jgi:tRNA(fMet)-specific endonuclease VapC
LAGGPVLDSDVLIDYLRGAGPGRDLVRALIQGVGYRVTAVTAFELALGRSYRENPRPVHALLSVPLLTLTRKAGLRGGSLLGELAARRRGDRRPPMRCRPVSASRPAQPS